MAELSPEVADQMKAILTEIQNALEDYVVPTQQQIEELYAEAQQRGCGLAVTDGKPGTLQVSPGVPSGMLAIIDPSALPPIHPPAPETPVTSLPPSITALESRILPRFLRATTDWKTK